MRGLAVLVFVVALGLPAGSQAHDCLCQTETGFHAEGSLVCLTVNGEERLARCRKVLNNTSWQFLEKGCPVASRSVPAVTVASVPTATLPKDKD